MFNKSSKPQNRIDSLIGATTRIEGNVIFTGGLRVDGLVRGNVAGRLGPGGKGRVLGQGGQGRGRQSQARGGGEKQAASDTHRESP